MRIVAITKVFPNAIVPMDEPHIRQHYAALKRFCSIEVLATIPYFPGIKAFSKHSYAGRIADAPAQEMIDGLVVHHPRFLHIPKVGLPISASLYAASLFRHVWKRRKSIDIILSTWAYPDGAAAVLLGKALNIPVVVEVIGSDINVVAEKESARFNLRQLLPKADRVIAVSQQLGHGVAALGVERDKIDIIPTGIDKNVFHPRDKRQARKDLGLDRNKKIFLYLGRLDRQKGVFELIQAFEELAKSDWKLIFVGADETGGELEKRAETLFSRVHFAGQQPTHNIPIWLAASDALVLPSWAEGTPNVILEALASGRPVVATDVGGIPDLITNDCQGKLFRARDIDGLKHALASVITESISPQEIVRASNVLTLEQSAEHVYHVLEKVLANR